MILKAVLLLEVALCVVGKPHAPAISEQHIIRHDVPLHRGHHGELGHIGAEPKHHEEYAWSYPSYEYSYIVNDPHTGDHKGQAEMRHGEVVKGEYWLIEPDGNKRTVKYHADKTGFHAKVHNSNGHIHHVPKVEEKPEIPEPLVLIEVVPEVNREQEPWMMNREKEPERERASERERENERKRKEENEKKIKREKEAERERKLKAEWEREKEAERERKLKAEWEREKEAERERKLKAEWERERKAELEREREAELERERKAEWEREHEKELERVRKVEREMERERERRREAERKREIERERERAERERAERRERERAEHEHAVRMERERKEKEERERAEREHEMMLERRPIVVEEHIIHHPVRKPVEIVERRPLVPLMPMYKPKLEQRPEPEGWYHGPRARHPRDGKQKKAEKDDKA